MKILWIVNIAFPELSQLMNQAVNPYGGWLFASAQALTQDSNVELAIGCPLKQNELIQVYQGEKISYFTLSSKKFEESFSTLAKSFKPDIVHIHGTEMSHAWIAQKKCLELNIKSVISIQGLISVISKHMETSLPIHVIRGKSLGNWILRNSIEQQRNRLSVNTQYEKEMLKSAQHVIGRTDLDRSFIHQINPIIQYHQCNESLRPVFYYDQWSLKKVERYTIFVSQAQANIKGFHIVLEAFKEVVKNYPQAKLVVAGENHILKVDLRNILIKSKYESYLETLIKQYQLESNIVFLGKLCDEQMKQHYLNSHVFVSASSIENESNSISEARYLGTPTLSSYVGGVFSRMTHMNDGILYPFDAPYLLTYYIEKVFSDDQLANRLSRNGRKIARELNNIKKNTQVLEDIYQKVIHD